MGEARITGAYRLPSRYVIHTVGPVWRGGAHGEKYSLAACYRNSLRLAKAHGCESVAFPLISSGAYGYPKDQALQVAMKSIRAFLLESEDDMLVYVVVFSKEAYEVSGKLFCGIRELIDDRYAEAHTDFRRENGRMRRARQLYDVGAFDLPEPMPVPQSMDKTISLEEALEQIDESFSKMVLRKIKEKGMKNSECYKKANLDKKLFSKINNDIHYKPKKPTALALAVALELSVSETRELLMKAGLALSSSEKFDIIVGYCIEHGQYDIFEINQILFYYDQPLLGAVVQ